MSSNFKTIIAIWKIPNQYYIFESDYLYIAVSEEDFMSSGHTSPVTLGDISAMDTVHNILNLWQIHEWGLVYEKFLNHEYGDPTEGTAPEWLINMWEARGVYKKRSKTEPECKCAIPAMHDADCKWMIWRVSKKEKRYTYTDPFASEIWD